MAHLEPTSSWSIKSPTRSTRAAIVLSSFRSPAKAATITDPTASSCTTPTLSRPEGDTTMKIHVEHDGQGHIHAVGVTVGGAGTTTLRPGPGRFVSEVEAPDVKDAKDIANLHQVKRSHRVEGHPAHPRLVRK